jgi:hypothetical protein
MLGCAIAPNCGGRLMARRARWIRLGPVDARDFHAACAGLAGSQGRAAAPIVLWACGKSPLDGLVPADKREFLFAVVAPVHVAPGRSARWVSWALSPVVAAYRDFGLRAYLSGAAIYLHGRRIGGGQAELIGDCVVIASKLKASFEGGALFDSVPHRSPEFGAWLREGLGLAMTQWGAEGDAPAERAFEAALRARIEAQHGWQFEYSWPNASERCAIDSARDSMFGFAAGLERRVPGAALSQADFAE